MEESSYFPGEKHGDIFKCLQSHPKCQERLNAIECSPQETASLESNLQEKVRQGSRKSVKVVVREEKSTETDTLEITLEAVPAHRTFAAL